MSVALLAMPAIAAALTVDYSIGTTLDVGTADLESTVINIVQWILGLLGLIAVVFILYGGFVWLTAGGNEEKVSTAKRVIGQAVVGLIIVLLAWAIVIFVVNTSADVTT